MSSKKRKWDDQNEQEEAARNSKSRSKPTRGKGERSKRRTQRDVPGNFQRGWSIERVPHLEELHDEDEERSLADPWMTRGRYYSEEEASTLGFLGDYFSSYDYDDEQGNWN